METMNNKICILTSIHSVFDGRIFKKEAKALVKAGYQVTLVAPHTMNETVDGVEIVAISRPKNRFMRILGTTCKALPVAMRQKAQIYHFHDPDLLPLGVILKLMGKKVVYDVHEEHHKAVLSRDYMPWPLRQFVSYMFNIFEKLCARCFDGVVAATETIQKRFETRKTICVHNYAHLSGETVTEKGDKKEAFRIIFSGRLHKDSGLSNVIKAIESLKNYDVRLVLIGEFEFSSKSYEDYLKSLGGWSRVEYLGKLPHAVVLQELARADLGIECFKSAPNSVFSLPTKVFEYMATGLPVLCSDLPGLKSVVETSQCGICVDETDPGKIAEQIKFFINNPELRKQMGKNGKRMVLEKYNWEKESEKLLQLYSNLFETSRSS